MDWKIGELVELYRARSGHEMPGWMGPSRNCVRGHRWYGICQVAGVHPHMPLTKCAKSVGL
eukprot:6936086-Prorocentrum_lima.AAC.1